MATHWAEEGQTTVDREANVTPVGSVSAVKDALDVPDDRITAPDEPKPTAMHRVVVEPVVAHATEVIRVMLTPDGRLCGVHTPVVWLYTLSAAVAVTPEPVPDSPVAMQVRTPTPGQVTPSSAAVADEKDTLSGVAWSEATATWVPAPTGTVTPVSV